MSPEVVSVGNLNIDLIGKLERLPDPDEKALLEEFNRRPGGGAANFAVACQGLGLGSGFVGCVGDDSFGEEILRDLNERGVDTSQVRRVKASTGLAFVFLSPVYDRLLIEHRGANSYLEPSDLREEYLRDSELVHASSVTPEIAIAVSEKAEKLGFKTSLDLGAELTMVEEENLVDILGGFDVCFMNKETFEDIFGTDATEQNILNHFPEELEYFVVTLGPEGAVASNGDEVVSSPSYKVEAKDTTGAGDTFAAVFDKFLLKGSSLEDTVKHAAAGAAIKVQHVGAREGLPTQEDLEEFIESRS